MGIYYIAANDEAKEWLDPWKIEHGGVKHGTIVLSRFADLCMYVAINRWESGVTIVDDCGDRYFEIKEAYKDLTAEMVEEFNRYYGPEHTIQLNPRAFEKPAGG